MRHFRLLLSSSAIALSLFSLLLGCSNHSTTVGGGNAGHGGAGGAGGAVVTVAADGPTGGSQAGAGGGTRDAAGGTHADAAAGGSAGSATGGDGGVGGALDVGGAADLACCFDVAPASDGADWRSQPDAEIDAPAKPEVDAPSVDTGASIEVPHRSDAVDYVIVAADNLAASARRYRDFRKASGFNVDLAMVGEIVEDSPDAATASARIRDYVRRRYQARDSARPFYLLLFGDAQAGWPGDGTGVPAGSWHAPSSESVVVSDNVYADVDGDDIPDLAVGRITADTDAEADLVRAKVAAYEARHDPGVWDRRLNIFASTTGLGDLADIAIEGIVYDITEAVPYAYDVTMTYARQLSPYVYVPEQFSDQVYRRINEGSLITAYVGHGRNDGFASLDWNGTAYPILDTDHLDKLAATHKSPILLFVACLTGAFAGADSVSERILVRDAAPTAIFSSTEISDPYANAVFIYETSQAFTSARAATVGDAFMLAKRRMMSNTDSVRLRIESVAALLVSAGARDALKHSHLHMYTLFGDPGMATSYPQIAQVSVDRPTATAGGEVNVSATVPGASVGAEASITLESPRRVILKELAAVPSDGDANRDPVIVKNYLAANDKVAASTTVWLSGPTLSAKLTVPSALPAGQYHVKVFVRDSDHDYAGSAPLAVK